MKTIKIIVLLFVLSSLLAVIVISASGDGIKIVSPLNGAGVTQIQNLLFNATYDNLTDIINPQSATFFLNISGVWQAIGSTSANGCIANSCSASITNTTVPDGVYGINVTVYNASSSASISNSANMTSVFYVDGAAPYYSNVTSPNSLANYSQRITLTAAANDATSGIANVTFNITNSNNVQSAVVTATQGNGLSAAFNTSGLADGYYNISLIVSDLIGNLNNTVKLPRILFDNTAPSVTHSCDDLTVTQDDTIDCNCTATDSLAGINLAFGSNGISFAAHPSTSSTGNDKQTTCTAEDTAGNRRVSTIYYNVSSNSNNNTNSGNSGNSGNSNSNSPANSSGSSAGNNSINLSSANTVTGNALFGNQGNDATPEAKERMTKIILISTAVLSFILLLLLAFKKIKRFIKTKNLYRR